MNILFIGGKGYIGQKIINFFNKNNHFCNIFDLKDGNDIRDRFCLDSHFRKNNYDIVVHLASLSDIEESERYPKEYINTNILGTKNIVDISQKYNIKKIVFFSDSCVLGESKDEEYLDENSLYNPKSLYAITKMTGEMIIKSSQIDYVIIRPFAVYGEDCSNSVICKWIKQIKNNQPISFYGNGQSKRQYLYINDLINVLDRVIVNNWADNEILHFAGNETISLQEIYDIFTEVRMEKRVLAKTNFLPIPKNKIKNSLTSTEKARGIIGFNPEANFKKTLYKILNKEL